MVRLLVRRDSSGKFQTEFVKTFIFIIIVIGVTIIFYFINFINLCAGTPSNCGKHLRLFKVKINV